MQCYETLTELIQGPCEDNQTSIVDGKFLDIAASLLSFNERSKELQKFAEAGITQDFFYLKD